MTSFFTRSSRLTANQTNFSFHNLPKLQKPNLFQINPNDVPRFESDGLRAFRFFGPNHYMQDGAADLTTEELSNNGDSELPEASHNYIKTTPEISEKTSTLLANIGLSPNDIQSLTNNNIDYYDDIAENGRYEGYLANVRYVGENNLTSDLLLDRLTRGGPFHLHQEYNHFGLTFKTTYQGTTYLFIQLNKDINLIPNTAQPCYLLELSFEENPDGSFIIERSLVSSFQKQTDILNNAVRNGDLQAALNTANPDKLIDEITNAQSYKNAALEGGNLYGFNGNLSGYMEKARIVNLVTPEGFCIQFEKYQYYVSLPGYKRSVNGLDQILENDESFSNHLQATAYLATGK